MGDNYPFPLLLKWDQGPESLRTMENKLKNKLQVYFNSKKSGGECEIRDIDYSRCHILIHFKEKTARNQVLMKEFHELNLPDKTTLHLTVCALKSGDLQTELVPSPSSGAAAIDLATEKIKKRSPNIGHPDGDAPDIAGAWGKQEDTSVSISRRGESENRQHREDSGTYRHNQQDGRAVSERSSSLDHQSNQVPRVEDTAPERGSPGGAAASDLSHSNNLLPNIDQIFGPVTTTLYNEKMPENVREGIMRTFPSLIKNKSADWIELMGTYDEITAVRHYLLKLEVGEVNSPDSLSREAMNLYNQEGIRAKVKNSTESRSRETRHLYNQEGKGAEVENSTESQSREGRHLYNQEGIGAEVENSTESRSWEAMQTDLPDGERAGMENPPESQRGEMLPNSEEGLLSVPSASCEYVMEIYQSEIDDIERRCHVQIVQHSTSGGATYIKFIPQGAQYSINSAKDAFTDKVQEAMGDWNQETVDSSIIQLSLAEIKQIVRSQWSRVLVIQQDGSFILRGPKKQISEAKMFLEKLETKRHFLEEDKHKSSRRRMPVTLSSSHMATEIPVDARHLDILRRLKSREISGIEQKYQVMMEEKNKNPKDGSVIVTFRPVNGSPDLSPHAAHSFIVLLQKTFFNINKTVIRLKKDYTKDYLHSLQEKMMAGGVDIIMEPSGDSLCLIGHPLHVTFVVDILNGVPDPDRAQASGASGSDMGEPMDTSESNTDNKRAKEDDNCPICLSEFSEKKILPKCKHAFCRGCLEQAMAIKPVCPICATPYGEIRGNQPDGTMREQTCRNDLPGYPRCGTIEIHYDIPSGIQQANHPHPGKHFSGATRTAYLPNNQEGREILKLLKKAFDRRLIFTVGDSRTSGATDIVTWNDIHHKTNTSGGAARFGYPDPDYLKRVREELKAKGIE